jgi:hypothetical protein
MSFRPTPSEESVAMTALGWLAIFLNDFTS